MGAATGRHGTAGTNPLRELAEAGQSVWLDDLHRGLFAEGTLARLIRDDGLAGLTSNPAILSAAVMGHREYAGAVASLLHGDRSSEEVYEALAIDDVGRAADLFAPLHAATGGADGFVSIEVSPHLADDAAQTVQEGLRLWERLGRPNVMIKVPGTEACLPAIRDLAAAGVNVNVTLLFSPERYLAAAGSWCAGLEARVARGEDIAQGASVASFFLSRIDSAVDPLLEALAARGQVAARSLLGRSATACAARAFELQRDLLASDRWQALAARGARPQRLLWASTSTKNPRYADVKYVEELVVPGTVTTLPYPTLEAWRDHGRIGQRLDRALAECAAVRESLERLGIDLDEVAAQLEREGVQKFVEPFDRLQDWLDERRRS